MTRDYFKYIWATDTHLWPWNRFKFLNTVLNEKPQGVFLTGDVSNFSDLFIDDLKFLGKRIGRPLYFVLGNHDYWGSNIEATHNRVKEVCAQYKNLVWMDDANVVSLNNEVALIGTRGWYDARIGNPKFLKYTFDWFLISDFKRLLTMEDRVEKFRELANESVAAITSKLKSALETHKTIYLLTHFPPWKEADRHNSLFGEAFWEPYNTNYILGQALEKVMEEHKKRYLIVLAGHIHTPSTVIVSRNITCHVGRGAYYKLSEDEIIYI